MRFGRIRCYEGGGCAAEVVQTHGLAELGPDVGADNVVDAAAGKGAALAGCPKPVMLPATEKARADFLKVAKQVGEEFLGNPETLGTLGLGVLWKEQNVHAAASNSRCRLTVRAAMLRRRISQTLMRAISSPLR